MRHLWVAVILIGVVCLLYANTFGSSLVWDDEYLIAKNRYLESWRYLPEIFQSSLHQFAPVRSNYYRPLQTVSFLLDRAIWHDAPWGYHLTNVLLHGLVGLLGYFLAGALGAGSFAAFLIGLCFIVHPIHTEAVSYISGRADSLAAVWILLSLLSFNRFHTSHRHPWSYIAALLFFFFSLLSKEIALALPFLLILLLWYRKETKRWTSILPFFLFLVLYGILRRTLLDFRLDPFPKETTSFWLRGKVTLESLFLYLKLILFPFPLHLERHLSYEGPFWKGEFLAGFFVAMLLVLLFLRSREKRKFLFGLGWFAIFFLPTSSLILKTDRVAEHFIYLAYLGILLAIFSGPLPEKRVVGGIAGIFVLSFSFLTIRQNRVWKDPEAFYRHTLRYAPKSWTALNNLGSLLEKKREWREAEFLLKEATALKPRRAEAYSNLATLFLKKRELAKAQTLYRRALHLRPGEAELHHNLGSVYRLEGKWNEAVKEYRLALDIDPGLVESHYFLAKTYETMGEKTLAEMEYRYLKKRGLRIEILK